MTTTEYPRLNAYEITIDGGVDYLALAPSREAAEAVVLECEEDDDAAIAHVTELSEEEQRARVIQNEDGDPAQTLWEIAGEGGEAVALTCSEW